MDEDKYFEEDREDDIYSKNEADELLEDGEIKEREGAFMKGYDDDLEIEELGKDYVKMCDYCGYEVDIDDRICPVCGAALKTAAEES